jgi:hypothetical protein
MTARFTLSRARDGYWQWCARPPGNDSVYGGFETAQAAYDDALRQLGPPPAPGYTMRDKLDDIATAHQWRHDGRGYTP